jgi:hypothetical protein
MRRIIGLILGFLALGFCLCLTLPFISKARMSANRASCANNVKQIVMGLHNYHDTFKSFPPGTVVNEALSPECRLSWIIPLLPYVERDNLYRSMDLSKAWNSAENQVVLPKN